MKKEDPIEGIQASISSFTTARRMNPYRIVLFATTVGKKKTVFLKLLFVFLKEDSNKDWGRLIYRPETVDYGIFVPNITEFSTSTLYPVSYTHLTLPTILLV